jgi:hypothetical protein
VFIGHGFEKRGRSYSYFILKDSNFSAIKAGNDRDIEVECINTQEVRELLKWPRYRSSNPPTIIIFDCCRSDLHFAQGFEETQDVFESQTDSRESFRILTAPSPRTMELSTTDLRNLFFIYSTSAGNTASDGINGKNGPFMEIFCALIQIPGTSAHDTLLELKRLLLEQNQMCVTQDSFTEKFFFGKKPAEALGSGNALDKKRKSMSREDDSKVTRCNQL